MVLALVGVGCGPATEREGTPDAGGVSACGIQGEKTGTQCSGLAECGSGPSNFIKPAFCEHCFPRPDTHVCEAGTCRPLNTSGANIEAAFKIPPAAAGSLSFTTASVNPMMADGTQTTCAALLSTCVVEGNAALNTGNSTPRAFGTAADPDLVYKTLIAADVGADRIIVVRVTSGTQGKGEVLAEGCKDGIRVASGEKTEIDLGELILP